jgi:hypothetical protein
VKIFISHSIDEKQFTIINQPKETEIIKSFDNPTKHLRRQEQYNTPEKREQIKECRRNAFSG